MLTKKSKKAEDLEELKPAPERIHVVKGYTWTEYLSILSGYHLFRFKGQEVFKFELFWSGINPYDVLDCKKGFHCQIIPEKKFNIWKI
jgi:hypothetical protein